ncbi:MAG: enoyl-CoA hydratase/isomerase family protein [Alphaproteobacteria bacterium]
MTPNALPDCETLLLRSGGGRLYVTFNRPERRNAMNNRMVSELHAVADHLIEDRTIRTVILRGAGGYFCAGGDNKERRNHIDSTTNTDNPAMARNRISGRLFDKFANLPQTTVAVVEGVALGGGFGFACLADITLVDTDAKLGMPETRLGIAPAQIAPYVVRRVGLPAARHMALTGRRIEGAEALALGIAQYLFRGAEELEATLESVLLEIEACGPAACAATKSIMGMAERLPADELIERAAEIFSELSSSAEGREGHLAFVEKRPPRWPGPEDDR